MADFSTAFEKTMQSEGGYANDPQDPGGETYKGVARKMHSKWEGWPIIDRLRSERGFPANLDSNNQLQQMIREFYEVNYWDKLRCDQIANQDIAEAVFDFGVNAGTSVSAKLAQMSACAEPDGVIGNATIERLNTVDPTTFLALFTVHKIARYVSICERRPTSKKYFFGWVKRALAGV